MYGFGGGSPGEHDNIYAQMEVEALARGEPVIQKPPEGRTVRSIDALQSTLLLVVFVGGVTWLAGGSLLIIVAAVVVSVAALVLIVAWRRSRSAGQAPEPTENR